MALLAVWSDKIQCPGFHQPFEMKFESGSWRHRMAPWSTQHHAHDRPSGDERWERSFLQERQSARLHNEHNLTCSESNVARSVAAVEFDVLDERTQLGQHLTPAGVV